MSNAKTRYDLAIIGSGSAAFAAAIAARARGASVVMAERATTGGTCVNTGCVPSKALLAAAEARHLAAAQAFPGINTEAGPVDFTALTGGKDTLVEQLRTAKYTDLAAEYGWEIVRGTASFTGGTDGPGLDINLHERGTTTFEATHYLIATGSAPWVPPIDGLAEAGYLTSATAMELDRLPESMIVIGGNSIGLEQGQMFARLGTKVTIIEALDRLAPFEEPEISQAIEDVLASEGIGSHTAATVIAVRRTGDGYTVTLADGGSTFELTGERLLVATGRRPVTAGLNLDTVGVKTGDRGQIIVEEHLRTSNPRIWAAGDVTGHPQFVYVAAAHGTLAAANVLDGTSQTLDHTALPRVTFTTPAIASAGLTETQADAAGFDHESRVLPLEHVPRAIVNRDARGLVKLVAEAGSGRLLGAHVIADSAGDVIAAAVLALSNDMTIDQIARTWSPYLTMAEALKLAAQTFTKDVTKLSCCAS